VGIGALVKDKTFYYFNFEHTTDIKDNLLNVPQLGYRDRERNNTLIIFHQKLIKFGI
jgi:hypothetical protein